MAPVTLQLGSLTIISLSDGALAAPAASFFPTAPAAAWEEEREFLTPEGIFGMNIGCFLVREGDHWTLVDTGDGTRPGSYGGKLLAGLRAAQVAPADITRVVFTHLHPDHAGGTTVEQDGDAVLVFSQAQHVLQRREWEAVPQLTAGFPHLRRCLDPVVTAGLLELVEGDVRLSAGITTLLTPGHTPGHQCVLLTSEGEQAVITGDLMHSPLQLNHPEWQLPAEWDPAESARQRVALVARLDQEGLTLCAGHYPYPSMGTVQRVEHRRRWQSVGPARPTASSPNHATT